MNKISSDVFYPIIDRQEPSETDYAPRTGLFLGSEGCWEMGGHRRGGWGETD